MDHDLLPCYPFVQIPGVLTGKEAEHFIAAAEAFQFQPQGSRGPAFGEVPCLQYLFNVQLPLMYLALSKAPDVA